MRIAVITGASSGLGREYVRQISRRYILDEIWAVARSTDKLNDLKKISACPVRIISADLTKKESIGLLSDMYRQFDPKIFCLVNCAGFGRIGRTADIPLDDLYDMIDLNCRAAAAISVISAAYMKKGSRIIQIASCSAFQPLPEINVYAASKAFLLSFSRSLRRELLPLGISVTAVCPYWIKDTAFIPTAMKTAKGTKIKYPFASVAENVVSCSLNDSSHNADVSTPGAVSSLHRLAAKAIPHSIMISLWDILRRL